MPVKYIDDKTGEFIKEALKNTGAPSVNGINTIENLVFSSSSMSTYN